MINLSYQEFLNKTPNPMTNPNLHQNISELKKIRFTNQEIVQNLQLQGFDKQDITLALDNYEVETEKEFKKKHPIFTNKFTPLVLMVLNYFLFFHAIPPAIANSFYVLFGIVGGVITIILSFWIFASLTPKLLENFPIAIGIISILSLFVFGGFFVYKTSDFETNQLKESGKMANAVVIDRTKIYGRRGNNITSITVKYLSAENKTEEATITVSNQEYNTYEEGVEIPILYSTENPSIARIAYEKTMDNSNK
jgi:hypothetical protein